MVLIDLGEPSRFEPGPPPGPRMDSLLSRSRRLLAGAAATIAAAGFLAGSPPTAYARPHLNVIGRMTGPLAPVIGDLVINTDQERGRLVAYALDGRGVVWTVDGVGAPNGLYEQGDGRLIAILYPGITEDVPGSGAKASVAAIDLATGRVLWRQFGFALTSGEVPIMLLSGTVSDPDAPAKLSGLSTSDGRILWTRTVAAHTQITAETTDAGPVRRAVLLGADGTVGSLRLADGAIEPMGRAVTGAALFAWRDLLVLRETSAEGLIDLAAYSLSRRKIIWRIPGDHALWPCDGVICQSDSGTFARLDPATGAIISTQTEQPPEPVAGLDGLDLTGWEAIGAYRDGQLLRLDPSYSADHQAWLGYAPYTPDGRAYALRPLMPLGGRANYCDLTQRWLYCDGSVIVDAVSVRLSDLDRLIGG
ncbi:outer membrane protein assembly factor BamB family protein [Hamadaea tsunoensis]|uniref:outer membrane protein assembly factor BamB family protein n=1 Tax=Hamadaea tsunoensis TaxID=53368 RepID=UPI0004001BE5|nr:PQQ-binding-like beta-propeller repeat protein [Hamadaea tsunoensis]